MSDVLVKKGQPFNWYNKDLTKSNQNCLYCGNYLGGGSEVPSNKEHLIARNFVPKGSLDGDCFNFIFRACQACNGLKASAERHISSITLFNSPGRSVDERIDALALHKGSKDYHPDKKGVLVKDAGDHQSIEFDWAPGAHFKFGLVGPPQLNSEMVCRLSCYHLQGIFSLITSEDPRDGAKLKLLPPSQIVCFDYYTHLDWGNPQLTEIARRSTDWEIYANIRTAGGYFKLMLKVCRTGTEEWFWALEWNKFLRIVGVICSPSIESALFSELPTLDWHPSPDGMGRIRIEVPLLAEEDILFPEPC